MTATGNTVSPPALIDDEGMNRKACTTYFGKSWNLQKYAVFFFGRCSKDVGKFPCLRARNLGFVWFLVTIEFFHNKNLRAEFPSNLHLVARNFFGGFLSNPHWLATSQHPETAPIKKWHGQDGRLGRGMEVLGRDVCPELEAVPGFEAMMERWMTVEMKMLGETAWEWQFFVCYD